MSDERSQFAQRIDERKFSLTRRGYDKREVRAYLEDLEQAFRELEGHSRRTAQRVAELERDLADARATEKVSVDNAMMAVFDAKDRILERARRRADEIEEQAHSEASRIKAAVVADVGGGEGGGREIAAATAQADEIVASARREAERIRREAEGGAGRDRDLEAELDAATAQLRRAHTDTAAAKEQLDAARKRIVELESGVGPATSPELEEKFADLDSRLRAARDGNERLEEELATRAEQVTTLEQAVAAAERALDESKAYVGRVESEADEKNGAIESLEAELTGLRAIADKYEEQNELVAELMKASAAADDPRVGELEQAVGTAEGALAEARQTIAELEAKLADQPDNAGTQQEVDAILTAARAEAEEIAAEAEEQAEQRAAKVIARAREEADQVRQTVATLTAQAEDARSAALRSKLEAKDLAEAQRAMGDARNDIITSANSRAEEIGCAARETAENLRREAEEMLTAARAVAEQITKDAEKQAADRLADAEKEAAGLVAGAEATATQAESGDELAAMLAEAERELAISEELRQQRNDLALREQELAERERAFAAKQQGEAQSLILPRDTVPTPAVEPLPDPAPEYVTEEDDDPADRLSALLEAVSLPPVEPVPVAEPDISPDPEPTPTGENPDSEPRPRMAWPAPNRLVEAERREAEAGSGEEGDEIAQDGEPRESRYRTRSAQLPRLGNQAKSNMTTMANLRKKSHRGG